MKYSETTELLEYKTITIVSMEDAEKIKNGATYDDTEDIVYNSIHNLDKSVLETELFKSAFPDIGEYEVIKVFKSYDSNCNLIIAKNESESNKKLIRTMPRATKCKMLDMESLNVKLLSEFSDYGDEYFNYLIDKTRVKELKELFMATIAFIGCHRDYPFARSRPILVREVESDEYKWTDYVYYSEFISHINRLIETDEEGKITEERRIYDEFMIHTNCTYGENDIHLVVNCYISFVKKYGNTIWILMQDNYDPKEKRWGIQST